MPLLEKTSMESEPSFYGALCIDHTPIGTLSGYFPIRSDPTPTSVMFQADEKFDEAT